MLFSLDDRQRRELWGLALLALAIVLALSLGNLAGVLGAHLRQAVWGVLGVGAVALPVVAALGGLAAFDKLSEGQALRWALLVAGVAVLVPATFAVLSHSPEGVPATTGWLGAALGGALETGMGAVGALVLVVFLFAALCVATVGWNPLRTALAGGRRAVGGARTLAAAVPLPNVHFRRPAPAADAEEEDDFLPPTDAELAAALTGVDPDATVLEPPLPRRGRPARGRAGVAEQVELLPPDSGDPAADAVPPSTLLAPPPPRDEARGRAELDKLGQVLIDKLATFKIDGEIVGMTVGPVVTQFEIAPAPGVKVARIANLEADLALALRAPSVRIVAPIPGKGAVGVEVPNPQPEMVYFREVLEAKEYRQSRAQLPLALGKDLGGAPYVVDLARMPHLLIAGATGSGKSVCINTIITSLVYRHTPRSLRFLMVDPKMVELSMYNDLPHLRHPVVTDNNDAAAVLKWAVLEMERRYELLSVNGVRNLNDFNRRVESGPPCRSPEPVGEEGDPDRWLYRGGELPYIVVIIDELADLMMTVQGDVEKPLALLAQKARAIGIHLILATQRPSVNVITGLIKANFPSRIAFRVSSKVDSRTILDQNGADALLGNGDLLLMPPGAGDPIRVQGAYLSTEETERLMDWFREQARLRREALAAQGVGVEPSPEENILDAVRAAEDTGELEPDEEAGERDKLFRDAAEICIQHQGGSTSLLQRRLRIGYGRAARIVDQLHLAGVLGPPDGSKPRDVLVDFADLERICGPR
ncbi:MAG TPA: DNA translocase FtsK 4TM domain-containing protein [Longimicrobiaceae bacterium]|nr:DNA translocase FtsK 4TM domain-containing protein [Longimicrobiaceae bacterium]